MANWHYYNKNGEKVGPISVAALKALVQQGLITRETLIENHTGRTVLAGEVNGLAFPEAAPKVAVDPIATAPMTAGGEVYGLSSPQPAMASPPVTPVQSAVVPPREADPFAVPVPMGSNPFTDSPSAGPMPAADTSSIASVTAKGKELAQRGKEDFTKGAKEVMGGLTAAKEAVQARIKLNALNVQLINACRSLGDAAEQAGWGGELCETV